MKCRKKNLLPTWIFQFPLNRSPLNNSFQENAKMKKDFYPLPYTHIRSIERNRRSRDSWKADIFFPRIGRANRRRPWHKTRPINQSRRNERRVERGWRGAEREWEKERKRKRGSKKGAESPRRRERDGGKGRGGSADAGHLDPREYRVRSRVNRD